MKTRFTVPAILTALILAATILSAATFETQSEWNVPASADTLKNPLAGNSAATAAGKKTYEKLCWACHGMNGKGDGPGAASLNPKPADHTSAQVQQQTDGAIYWKISKGRGTMQPYERSLSKTQRWQLVNYIRTLRQE
jgi:mono/diheme cytochrome c family protein